MKAILIGSVLLCMMVGGAVLFGFAGGQSNLTPRNDALHDFARLLRAGEDLGYFIEYDSERVRPGAAPLRYREVAIRRADVILSAQPDSLVAIDVGSRNSVTCSTTADGPQCQRTGTLPANVPISDAATIGGFVSVDAARVTQRPGRVIAGIATTCYLVTALDARANDFAGERCLDATGVPLATETNRAGVVTRQTVRTRHALASDSDVSAQLGRFGISDFPASR